MYFLRLWSGIAVRTLVSLAGNCNRLDCGLPTVIGISNSLVHTSPWTPKGTVERSTSTLVAGIRRQEPAKPHLVEIRSRITAAQSVALPSSALSKACRYALTLWKKLTRFLEYPELELSTNLAENSMRPVALGRKNWLHIGSPPAGPKVAAILSVVESC